MPRSSTVTVTLPDGLMDALQHRAGRTGWSVGAEIKATVREYLKAPQTDDVEGEMHRTDLVRSHKAVRARKEWRHDVTSEAEAPYPTSTVVVAFPRELMKTLEARKYGRRGGTLAGEVRIALRSVLKWKDDDH